MRVAVVGSRGMRVDDLRAYLPLDTTVIISGGARGVDASAKEYAIRNGLTYVEHLPQYDRYGKAAPLKRNQQIVDMRIMSLPSGMGNPKDKARYRTVQKMRRCTEGGYAAQYLLESEIYLRYDLLK